jgi:hypothetical protein
MVASPSLEQKVVWLSVHLANVDMPPTLSQPALPHTFHTFHLTEKRGHDRDER